MAGHPAFIAAAEDSCGPIPDALARQERARQAERSICPGEALDQKRLRTKLDAMLDVIFPENAAEGDHARNREIVLRRWVDETPRHVVATEFGLTPYRVKTIEDDAFKRAVRARGALVAFMDETSPIMQILHRPLMPPLHVSRRATP